MYNTPPQGVSAHWLRTADLDHLLEAVIIMQGPPAKALDSDLPVQKIKLVFFSPGVSVRKTSLILAK